jgi:hypothetical protein
MSMGSKFNHFFKGEGIFESTTAVVIKKIAAVEVAQEIEVHVPSEDIHLKRKDSGKSLSK